MRSFGSVILILVILSLLSCRDQKEDDMQVEPAVLLKGMDISFLPEIRKYGVNFKDRESAEKDLLQIIKGSGVNLVRIRLWTGDVGGPSGEDEVTALVRECRDLGFRILLDLHYSDTWADPAHQTKPAVWNDLEQEELADSVYHYTFRIVSKMKPDYVQVGNEINGGLLWDNGKYNNETGFYQLLKSGTDAVRAARADCGIVLHYAGYEGSEAFFEKIRNAGIDFDIIGLSYYPYWHGKSLSSVESTLNNLQQKLGKKAFIAEFSYPFTLGWADHTNNVTGLESQLYNGYPATRDGQRTFVRDIRTLCERSSSLGFCYWGGEWVAFKGDTSTSGSSWENQALFNFDLMANPALDEFR